MKKLILTKNKKLADGQHLLEVQDEKGKPIYKGHANTTVLPDGEYDLELILDKERGRNLWTITKGDNKGFKIYPIPGYEEEDNGMVVIHNPLIIDKKLVVSRSRDGLPYLKSALRGERKAKLVLKSEAKAKKPATTAVPKKTTPKNAKKK